MNKHIGTCLASRFPSPHQSPKLMDLIFFDPQMQTGIKNSRALETFAEAHPGHNLGAARRPGRVFDDVGWLEERLAKYKLLFQIKNGLFSKLQYTA